MAAASSASPASVAAAPGPTTVLVGNAIELVLLLAGLYLLWTLWLRPLRRRTPAAAVLPDWRPPTSDFLLYLVVIAAGAVIGSTALGLLASRFHASADTAQILGTAGLHLGIVTTALLLPLRAGAGPFNLAALRSGVATFLIALPPVLLVTWAWMHVLQACGVSTDQQDVVALFLRADSPVTLGLMIVLPTVVAPIGEELLFRATFFRFLRGTGAPRALVLLLPAAIFGLSHVSLVAFLPLVVLAVVFSLAYERTGRIGTTMVAHALFNLHTVVLLLAGLNG